MTLGALLTLTTTWVLLHLVAQFLYARSDAGLAEYSDGIFGRASQAPHGVEDALRERLTRSLEDDQERNAKYVLVLVVWRLQSLDELWHRPGGQ